MTTPRRPLPLVACALLAFAGMAPAEGAIAADAASDAVSVCYNYGCLTQSDVFYRDAELARVGELLGDAKSPVHERALLGVAVGWLLGIAGQRSPIAADRGGNLADDGVYGRMDCIDHATTTTRLLRLLEARSFLHFHRVLDPAKRTRAILFEHFAAQIEEIASRPAAVLTATDAISDGDATLARRYVVDSWYVDNGQPAPVLALQRWQDGEGPDDE